MHFLYIVSFVILFFTACEVDSQDTNTQTNSQTSTAVLVDENVSGVQYYCDNEYLGLTGGDDNVSGKFSYKNNCNAIVFKIGEITLAEMKPIDINNDDIVYITDLVGKDRNDTNNTSVKNVIRLLQTLDDDNDPRNGIFITQEIRDSITQRLNYPISDELISEQDLQNTLIDNNINKQLIPSINALVHFENVLRDDNIPVDTVAPFKPYLSTNILATSDYQTYIDINGEESTKILLNNIDTNKSLDKNGYYGEFKLDTNLSNNTFGEYNISLKDDYNHTSEQLILRILMDTKDPKFEGINQRFDENNITITEVTKHITDLNITDNSLEYNLTLQYEITGDHKELVELNTTSLSLDFISVPSNGTYKFNVHVTDEALHENFAKFNVIVNY
jgi:hypothetical protein